MHVTGSRTIIASDDNPVDDDQHTHAHGSTHETIQSNTEACEHRSVSVSQRTSARNDLPGQHEQGCSSKVGGVG